MRVGSAPIKLGSSPVSDVAAVGGERPDDGDAHDGEMGVFFHIEDDHFACSGDQGDFYDDFHMNDFFEQVGLYSFQQLDADQDSIGDVCDGAPGCGGCGQPDCAMGGRMAVARLGRSSARSSARPSGPG